MKAHHTWILASTLASAFALVSAPAHACKCMVQSVEQAKEQARAIFEGQVTRVEDVPSAHDPSLIEKRVTFSIVRVWKELEKAESVSITTSASTASCGYPFEQGSSYLVYAGKSDQGYSVSTCSRTRPVSDAGEDLAALGGGITPVEIKPAEPALPQEPKPTAAPKRGGCASSPTLPTNAPKSAGLLWLALPALGLVLRRRRE